MNDPEGNRQHRVPSPIAARWVPRLLAASLLYIIGASHTNQNKCMRTTHLKYLPHLQPVKIPVTLYKGANQLLIKTNNQQNRDRPLWAINCVIE